MELLGAPKSCQEKTIPERDLDQAFVGRWGEGPLVGWEGRSLVILGFMLRDDTSQG